jgi:hypothetical protein
VSELRISPGGELQAPEDLAPIDEKELGTRLLRLVDQQHEWVNRRVESVEFCDDKATRHSVSVDFTIPEPAPYLVQSGRRVGVLVPLALLGKQALVGFDVFDENGRSLPLLNASQSDNIVAHGLIRVARWVIHGDANTPLDDNIENEIKLIVGGKQGARRAKDNFEEAPRDDPHHFKLGRDSIFRPQLDRYERGFLMLVLLQAEAGERRVLKFRYSEAFTRQGGPWRLLIGEPEVAQLNLPSVKDGGYHLEVDLPSGVRVVNARVATHERTDEEKRYKSPKANVQIVGSKVHLCVRYFPTNAPETLAKISLRAARLGWFSGACCCAWIIAAILGMGAFLFRTHTLAALGGQPAIANTGATLLLVIPAVFATLLVRSSEHAMVAHLLRVIRVLLAASGLLAYSAAATLFLAHSDLKMRRSWSVYALLATISAVTITLGLLTPAIGRLRARLPIIFGGALTCVAAGAYLFHASTMGPLWGATLIGGVLAGASLLIGFAVAWRTALRERAATGEAGESA